MSEIAEQRVDWLLCLMIAVAVFILLAPWLLDESLAIISPTELGTDFITKQWPNAVYIAQAWQQWGQVPLWRTTAMGGVPIAGNPSMLLAYPLYWLVFLFPVSWAFTLYFALHLVWAGWGVYGLARRVLRLSPGGALLTALMFALSAKMAAHLGGGHIDIVAAVAWQPWLWLAVDRLARRPGWLPVVGAAVAAAAQALTHLPTLWLGALVIGCWGLYVRLADRATGALRRWLITGFAGLGAITLAAGLSAVQIWPLLELLPFSSRGAMTLSEAGQYALPVPLLVGLAIPTSLAFPEWVIYAGVVTLMLSPASWLARGRAREWGFLVALVILGLIFSLGCATPLFPLIFRLVPGMNWLRVPSRMMFLVQLAWALLAGMGWDALGRAGLRQKSALAGWWIVLILLLAIGAVWGYHFPSALAVPVGSVVVATMAMAVLMWRSRARELYVSAALAALVVIEALALAPQFIARERMSALATSAPAVDFLTSQSGRFRVYSPHGLISLAQAVTNSIETVDGNDPFQFNHYVYWANAASGCDLEAYAVAVPACISNEVDPHAYLRAQPDGELLGIGNTRYVVADHFLSQWPSLIWQSGTMRVYENPAVLPRAFVVPSVVVESNDAAALTLLQTHNPKEIATVSRVPEGILPSGGLYCAGRVIRRTPNYVTAQADGPGWLLFGEVWSPGWRALVDGVPATVYRTDVTFCGLPIPDGSHTVTLMYAPSGWVWGRWVSLGAVVITTAITAVALWKQRRNAATATARK